MENKLYSESKGGVTASLYAIVENDKLIDISFPCVSKDDKGIEMEIRLTPYGLKNNYQGEDRADVDGALKKVENKLKKAYGLVFEVEPQIEIPQIEESVNE